MDEKTTPDVIIEDETEQSDVFKEYDEQPEKSKKSKKTTATTKTLIIAVCAAVVLAAVLLTLLFLPKETEKIDTTGAASITTKLDKNKVWQVEIKTKNGKIEENGSGNLLTLVPADIKTIKLDNDKGTTTITSYTPKTKETDPSTGKEVEKTDQTQYTVKGYEKYELQSGEPDEVANVCATLSFKSVSSVDAGDKLSDFGFDSPKCVANVTYTDGTKSVIKVGSDAPQNLGTYVMFGSSKAVFLCESDTIKHLLYGITDLINLNINEAASDTEQAGFKTAELSGANFKQKVVIKPNENNEIQSDYVITSPAEIFADNTEASNISGGIRGLIAKKVLAVNPNSDRLKKLGLSSPYAEIKAVYSDTTINLVASKPDSDGNCSLMKKGGNIVYQISSDKIAWVNSGYEKLISESVLEVDLKSLSNLKVDGYSFDITTKTSNTTDDNGEESSTAKTTTKYNGEEIDEGNFETFFSNISLLKKKDKTASKPSGKSILTITYTYSSGRSSDTLEFYKDGSYCVVTINGTVVGTVDSTYVEKIGAQAKAASKGDQVKSFW